MRRSGSGAPHRSYDQSVYRLDYSHAGAAVGLLSLDRWSAVAGWFAVAVLTPMAWLTIRRRIAVGV